jgi:hypothetical protein
MGDLAAADTREAVRQRRRRRVDGAAADLTADARHAAVEDRVGHQRAGDDEKEQQCDERPGPVVEGGDLVEEGKGLVDHRRLSIWERPIGA